MLRSFNVKSIQHNEELPCPKWPYTLAKKWEGVGAEEKERERTQFRPNPDKVQCLDLVQEEESIDDIEKEWPEKGREKTRRSGKPRKLSIPKRRGCQQS